MKDLEYEYDYYVPKTFAVGMSKSSSNAGFPTMKDSKGRWTNLGVFEKICGFKPYTQRSELKEIDKAMNQAVQEAKNVPTSEFKLVNVHENIYDSMTELFDRVQCCILHDPRGWDITISQNNLQKILEASHFNIKDGEILDVKLMYAWPAAHECKETPFALLPADDAALEMQDATSALNEKHDSIEFIKPKVYEIGKAYWSDEPKMNGHKFMYLGVHDIYSAQLHLNALLEGKYDIKRKLEDKYDMTSKDMHVFYCLSFKRQDVSEWHLPNQMPAGRTPYFIVRNLSKLFEHAEELPSTSFQMYNSDKPATYENIKEDMSQSLMFNLLDLSSKHLADFDKQAFEDVCGNLHETGSDEHNLIRCKTYPFAVSSKIVMRCKQPHDYEMIDSFLGMTRKRQFSSFTLGAGMTAYAVGSVTHGDSWYNSHMIVYFRRNFTKENKHDVLRALYDELQPQVMQWKLENGKDVPAWQNAMLNTVKQSV